LRFLWLGAGPTVEREAIAARERLGR